MEMEYYIHNVFELKNIKLSQNENMLLQSPLNCKLFCLDIRYVFDAPKFISLVSRSNDVTEVMFEQGISG